MPLYKFQEANKQAFKQASIQSNKHSNNRKARRMHMVIFDARVFVNHFILKWFCGKIN
jgi:hypothetical protein